MARVIFLSGTTMGDSLGEIGRSQKDVYASLGYDFDEVHLSQSDWPALLDRALAKRNIECVVAFMGMGAEMPGQTPTGDSVNLWDGMGIPFISLFGDTPAYFFDRHVMPSARCASLYAFSEHYALRKRLPQIRGLLGVMPPVPLDAVANSKVDFAAKERGKLYFLKNGNDPEQLLETWRQALSPTMFLMIMDIATDLASDLASERGCDIDSQVTEYFRGKGLDVETLINLRLFFVAQIDDYLRRLKSTFIARTLLDFPIEVHGYNWEHVDFSGKRATLVPGGTYGQSRPLILNALATLDMSPNTSSSPHERVSRAIGMYTLCLTNEQSFYKDELPGFEDCLYRFERDSLRGKIDDVLTRPKQSVELGRVMAEAFRAKFDPEGAARRILEAASCVRMAQGGRTHQMQDFFVWPPTRAG
jgi:hypothetical protein